MNVANVTRRVTHALRQSAAGLWLGGSLLLAVPAAAQLDASCTVSVLNRSIPVAADGFWVLPNVPANQGLVRARAEALYATLTTGATSP